MIALEKKAISNILVIDFETYYAKDFTLKKLTTSEYIKDQRFEVIGVGVMDSEENGRFMRPSEFTEFAKSVDWTTCAVIAHHAHFDGLVLSHHFGIRPGFWFDTLSMANLLGLNASVGGSLAKLMEHFGVGRKGDEVHNVMGLHLDDFSPDEYARYGEYCLNDCLGTLRIFKCMQDALPEQEAAVVDFTVRMFTEPVLRFDSAMLHEALAQEQERKSVLLERSGLSREDLLSNPKFAALLESLGVAPPTKTSPATGKSTFAFAKSDPGLKSLLESPNDEVRWAAEARIGVKSTIAESRISRMLGLPMPDGAAPVYLKVAAAHTQRWGGGDKTNFQNFPRSGPLRQALMAPDGHVLIACDSAQIEARGLAWLSGESELLSSFAQNKDVYSEFASVAYGRPIDRKRNKEDETPGFVGKVCVLGLGYGMGWRKLAGTLLLGAMGGPPIQFGRTEAEALGVDVDAFFQMNAAALAEFPTRLSLPDLTTHCAVAKLLVDRYRKKNKQIRKFWEVAAELIISMDSDSLRPRFGPNEVFAVERAAILRPSGLRLRYDDLRQDAEGWSYRISPRSKERARIYGGLLTENIVQAFCRDIVAHQAAVIHMNFGYKIATTTHDEIVVCVRDEQAHEALNNVLSVMCTSPRWCEGLPLNAEAGSAKRYGNC